MVSGVGYAVAVQQSPTALSGVTLVKRFGLIREEILQLSRFAIFEEVGKVRVISTKIPSLPRVGTYVKVPLVSILAWMLAHQPMT
jgi:hypothetical protein